MSTPEQIVDTELSFGNRRSAEYRRGMIDVLRYHLEGARIQCPYPEGSVQFDAYFAGNDRGHLVWRELADSFATNATTSGKSRCADRCTLDRRNELGKLRQDGGSHEIRRA